MQFNLFVALLLRLLVACSTLQFCEAAPTNATVVANVLSRAGAYVPSDQECDDRLRANGFNGKAIFWTGNANASPWRSELGYNTLTNAYGGAYLSRALNQNGPLAGVLDDNHPLARSIWSQLSARFALATKGDAYFAMNAGQVALPTSIWVTVEFPILIARPEGRVLFVVADDLNSTPLQIWPPPALGIPTNPNSQ